MTDKTIYSTWKAFLCCILITIKPADVAMLVKKKRKYIGSCEYSLMYIQYIVCTRSVPYELIIVRTVLTKN